MSTARFRPVDPAPTAADDRPELQRVVVADGLSPLSHLTVEVDPAPGTRSAPLTLLWHARHAHLAAPGQFRVTIPVAGGPPEEGASRRLNHVLRGRWQEIAGYEGPRIRTALAVFTEAIGPAPRDGCVLTLLMTTDPARPGHASIDGTPLAAHLCRALRVLDT